MWGPPVSLGRGATQTAALAVLLVVVLILSPALLIYSVLPSARIFLLLEELRSWLHNILAPSTAAPDREPPETPPPKQARTVATGDRPEEITAALKP
jgi:hypothetical protein